MKEWVGNRCLSLEEGANGCGEERVGCVCLYEAEQVGEGLSTSSPHCSRPGLWVTSRFCGSRFKKIKELHKITQRYFPDCPCPRLLLQTCIRILLKVPRAESCLLRSMKVALSQTLVPALCIMSAADPDLAVASSVPLLQRCWVNSLPGPLACVLMVLASRDPLYSNILVPGSGAFSANIEVLSTNGFKRQFMLTPPLG